ncbi:MAG TPA: alpha/beta hydrolase [Magnetospirillaceae bacterium]|nr:alpha/beta hydrolase [Magnetospirillaceae bacterium]
MSLYRDVFYSSLDGLRLHARDYGDEHAPLTVLCMPGLSRNARDFEPVAERLAPRFRILCAEQRGRGESAYDPKPKNYHPGTYVGDMVALLDHLRLARVAMIGTSLGGLMAMMMAAGLPDRVAGIVVNDVGPEVAIEGLVKIQSYIDRVTNVGSWDQAIEDVSRVFGASFPAYGRADWERAARALYKENERGVPVLDFDPRIADNFKTLEPKALDMWPVFDALPKIPFGLVRGKLSDLLTAPIMEEMLRRRPDIVLAEIDDSGHAPTLDEPPARAVIDRVLGAIIQG